MEEKETKVPSVATEDVNEGRMTYEQLNNIAGSLSYQLEEAKKQIQAINMANLFKRLDYLFKVVELGSKFGEEFTQACVNEIKSLMTVPEDKEEKEDEQQA